MRVLSVLLLLALIGVSFAGCGDGQTKSASALMEKLVFELKTVPTYRLYAKADGKNFSKEDFSYLYTGSYASGQEIDGVEDYCLLLSVRPTVFEIHIIQAVSASGVRSLVKLLSKRASLLRRYLDAGKSSEDGGFGQESAEPVILVYGQTVVLVATDRNEEIRSLLDRVFRRKAEVYTVT